MTYRNSYFAYSYVLLACMAAGSGCANRHTNIILTTTITTENTTTSADGNNSSNGTMSFTAQQFVAALAAHAPAPNGVANNNNVVTFSFQGSTLLKSPDLQGANNVVIYNGPNGGGTYAVDLGVFAGMTVQQAVQAYISALNPYGTTFNQYVSAQTVVLVNGKVLTVGYEQASAGLGPAVTYNCSSSTGVCTPDNSITYPSSGGSPYVVGDINSVSQSGTNISGVALYQDLGGDVYSNNSNTKDVDLQRADLQDQKLDTSAHALADQFQMTFENARQLAQLSDKLQTLTASGQITDEAREELANSALDVAGISSDDVNGAVAQMIQNGNQQPIQALMDKAATNLGMPSSAGLRDQLLPSLGIHLE